MMGVASISGQQAVLPSQSGMERSSDQLPWPMGQRVEMSHSTPRK